MTEDKELTKKEMEDTVGGRKTRRLNTDAAPAGTELNLGEEPSSGAEPLPDPSGGFTPGGKSV